MSDPLPLQSNILFLDIETPGTPRVKAFAGAVYSNGALTDDAMFIVLQVAKSDWTVRCIREFWSNPGPAALLEQWRNIEVPYPDGLAAIWVWVQKMHRKYPDLILSSDNTSFDLGTLDSELYRVHGLDALRYAITDPTLVLDGKSDTEILRNMQSGLKAENRNEIKIARSYESVLDCSDYAQALHELYGCDIKIMSKALNTPMVYSNDHHPLNDARHMGEKMMIVCRYVTKFKIMLPV
jgi:hypothetical protein